MPQIEIYVSEDDLAATKRIAEKMFPDVADRIEAKFVIASAVVLGVERLKVVWGAQLPVGHPNNPATRLDNEERN